MSEFCMFPYCELLSNPYYILYYINILNYIMMGVGYRDSVLYMKPTLTSDREAIPPPTLELDDFLSSFV